MQKRGRTLDRNRVARILLAGGVLVAGATLGAAVDRGPGVDAATAAEITTLNPARFLDTRAGERTVDGRFQATGRVAAGREFAVTIAGRGGVPADAAAAMMNVTAVRPDGPGHLAVYPCGTTRPNVSNINYQGGDVAPNAVLSKIGAGGQVCVTSVRAADLIIDVNGFVPTGGSPIPIQPARYADTRPGESTIDGQLQGGGRIAGGTEYRFSIAGRPGIPQDATAAMMNVTAVRPDGPGHLAVYPCGTTRPNVSNINYQGGDVAPNAVLSKIGTDGQVCVTSLRGTDLIIDVSAFVPPGGSPTPIEPARYADSRAGETTIDGQFQATGRLDGGKEYSFTVAGRAGVPDRAAAAMMNITAVRPDGPGHITVYPCGTTRPVASNINYRGGDVAPNAVLSRLDPLGQVCVYSLRATDLVIDVNAYVAGPPDVYAPTTTTTIASPPPTSGPPSPRGCVIGGRPVVTRISGPECTALVDLYNSTDGAQWSARSGWATPTDPCWWFGVECVSGQLTGLNLTGNDLAGPLPPSIGNLVNLRTLDLSTNYLGGSIPASIGQLTNLRTLDLQFNWFTGAIPSNIGQLANLVYLDLSYNADLDEVGLSGPIPATIFDLPKLTYLDLSSNSLSGEVPSGVGKLTKLTHFNVGDNQLTGSLPDTIGSLYALRYLGAYDNEFTGWIPVTIGNLTSLERLDLRRNKFRGAIPTTVGSLTQLTELMLRGNSLTGSLPGSIGNLRNLQSLDLTDNALTGPIPTSIGNLTSLKRLDLDYNSFMGPIPTSIGKLTQLNELFLTANQLSGPIPDIGTLSNLTRLSLAQNQLTGPIPDRIGNLNKLTALYLFDNRFTGPIPATIGNLTLLQFLGLDANQLSGPVPPTIMNLTNLSALWLSDNWCLTASSSRLQTWLTDLDPAWNDGCIETTD